MKISYGRNMVSPDGGAFTQRILMTEHEFESLNNAILSEIAMNYPQREKYLFTKSDAECVFRFPKLRVITVKKDYLTGEKIRVAFLKIPHVLYMTKFKELAKRLKTDQNTYIEIQ